MTALSCPQEAHAFIEEALADAELAAGPLRGQRPALLFCGDLNSGGAGHSCTCQLMDGMWGSNTPSAWKDGPFA